MGMGKGVETSIPGSKTAGHDSSDPRLLQSQEGTDSAVRRQRKGIGSRSPSRGTTCVVCKQSSDSNRVQIRTNREGDAGSGLCTGQISSVHLWSPHENHHGPQASTVNLWQATRLGPQTTARNAPLDSKV